MTAHNAGTKFNSGKIFGSKLKLIQVAKHDLGMTDENYRALLMRIAGVKSSRDLTEEGFDAVMAELKRMGFIHKKSNRKPKGAGGTAPNHPTPGQWRLIEDSVKRVGYDGLEDPRFINWMKSRGHVEHPRFLDTDGAQRVIKALSNWIGKLI
ncbi:MAG: regulatory protein GemA [Gallionella sp.]